MRPPGLAMGPGQIIRKLDRNEVQLQPRARPFPIAICALAAGDGGRVPNRCCATAAQACPLPTPGLMRASPSCPQRWPVPASHLPVAWAAPASRPQAAWYRRMISAKS